MENKHLSNVLHDTYKIYNSGWKQNLEKYLNNRVLQNVPFKIFLHKNANSNNNNDHGLFRSLFLFLFGSQN